MLGAAAAAPRASRPVRTGLDWLMPGRSDDRTPGSKPVAQTKLRSASRTHDICGDEQFGLVFVVSELLRSGPVWSGLD